MPNLIINKKDCVFINIESGKPHKDGINRTVQKSQTGASCFFSSVNMIRDRYHVPQYEGSKERATEQKVSATKKLIQHVTDKYLAIMGNLRDFAEGKVIVTDKNVDGILNLCNSVNQNNPTPEQLAESNYFTSFLKEFKKRENKAETAIDFAKKCEHLELSNIIEEIKKSLEIDIEISYKETYPTFATNTPWDQIDNEDKIALSISLIQKKCYQLSLLTASKWHPEKNNFNDLLDQLRSNGPMLVCGKFGRMFYKKTAESCSYKHKVDDKTIDCIGFKATDYIDTSQQQTSLTMFHSVVLVGGNIIEKKPFIYFLDPIDASLPNKQRTVYVMSFENFCKRIFTIHALELSKDNGQPFAIYNPSCKLSYKA